MSTDRLPALEEQVAKYQAALLERGDTLSFNTQLLLGELVAALRGVPPTDALTALQKALDEDRATAEALYRQLHALREAAASVTRRMRRW